MFKSLSDLCDVISHVVYCPDDETILITLEANCNEYWIPSTKMAPGTGWFAQSIKDIDEIFGIVLQNIKLLKLCKVWVPNHTSDFVYHCIYYVTMSGERKKHLKTTYGRFRGKVKWVDEVELKKMCTENFLRSPEIVEFLQLCKGSSPSMLQEGIITAASLPAEFLACGGFVELTDRAIIDTSSAGIYEQLIESASYNKEAEELTLSLSTNPIATTVLDFMSSLSKIQREPAAVIKSSNLPVEIHLILLDQKPPGLCDLSKFVFMCFPALYMCQQVFSRLVAILGWPKLEGSLLFRAADISGRYGISFRELVIILAAIEPSTGHGGSPAEIRCRYMFRYFDRDCDSFLNFEEFKQLIGAVRKSKKQLLDPASLNEEAGASFKSIGLVPEVGKLSLGDFLRAVGDLKLRGTSQIFRSLIGIQQYLYTVQDTTKPLSADQGKQDINAKMSKQMAPKKMMKTEEYSLGNHVLNLQRNGAMITLEQLTHLQSALSPSSTQQTINKEPKRKLSQEMFAQVSLPNEILRSLRYLIQGNHNLKAPTKGAKPKDCAPYAWGQVDPAHFGKNFIVICNQVKDILRMEQRLIEVQAPAYILGDLHGNFNSLLHFESLLWSLGLSLCPCNLLLLGDYVDRGPHSMEVIAYLFAYKIQAPKKLVLLRGNHEIRDVQKIFTFYTECLVKFGEKLGAEVWNAINATFDAMPIAATLDGKVFCCHGGIPPPWLCPTAAAINSVPCPLPNPDERSALAWEIMWNDPIRTTQVSDQVSLELQANEGFATNSRRGTGHIFNADALERFLSTNGYSHLIRAHEVAESGFNLIQKGKLLTVFSSARYCGGSNQAACILADQGKLRILKIETS